MGASILIENARIVDGAGSPSVTGSVAIDGSRIVAVGSFDGEADRVIDAGGKVVAPGFIDVHTHYDPQICWDRLATPSIEHGVTSVVMGNCSLSLAPVRPEGTTKLAAMFKQIEDIPMATFEQGVPWTWESFEDYLDHIRPGLGINVGALVGHSALRYYVMGPESQEREATESEVTRMCELLTEAMAAGALGLSTSYVDVDENLKPVPSRLSSLDERMALAHAMARGTRGVMQTVPVFYDGKKQLECIEELGQISRETGIMCTLAPIVQSPFNPDLWGKSLAKLEEVWEQGGRVYGQSMPRPFDLNLRLSETSFLLYALPAWNELMGLPIEARIEGFRDAGRRKDLVAQGQLLAMLFGKMRVGETFCEANHSMEGRLLSEIATQRDQLLSEVMIDIALEDELRTEFQVRDTIHADPIHVAKKILDHDCIHIGASDAGAHIAQFCGAGDTAYLLSHFVRERGDMTLERAVHRLTGELARDWGIADRGLLEAGRHADLVIFDPDTVARGEEIFVHDVPGDASRYVRHAEGFDRVLINGEVVFESGGYTDARPGVIV